MGRPREYDDATRAALIDAASRRLASGGPSAVTLRDVAADVGASTRAIYALFGSKMALLRAVHAAGFAGLAEELATVRATDEPLRDLYELGMAYRRSALARPTLYLVMFGVQGDDMSHEANREFGSGTLDRLRDAVRRCTETGALGGGGVEALTLQLWALVHGLALLELSGALGTPDEAASHWAGALQAIARGYVAGDG